MFTSKLRKLVLIPLLMFGLAIAFLLTTPNASLAKTVIRYPNLTSNIPISQSVEVSNNSTTIYVSGQVPSIVDANAKQNLIASFGDTKTQAIGVFQKIENILTDLGLTLGDVVKMQVFLVGDPNNGGKINLAGFTEGYNQFFGTKQQPNLPARSLVQVAALSNPGWLMEIEVTAVRPNSEHSRGNRIRD